MKTQLKTALIGGGTLLAAAAVLAGTLSQPGNPAAAGTTALPTATVQTSLPGLVPAAGEPELAGLQTSHPKTGQTVQIAGPFDDRFVLARSAFTAAGATGTIRVTSDVSDLIELQIIAGFYDAQGQLTGTGRFEHGSKDDENNHTDTPAEGESFTIPVPGDLPGTAASAAVGVPVLVNE